LAGLTQIGLGASGRLVRRVGAVVKGRAAALPWLVVDRDGIEVPEAVEYLRHTVVVSFSAASVGRRGHPQRGVEPGGRAIVRWAAGSVGRRRT
jgi:hypothetical protein